MLRNLLSVRKNVARDVFVRKKKCGMSFVNATSNDGKDSADLGSGGNSQKKKYQYVIFWL